MRRACARHWGARRRRLLPLSTIAIAAAAFGVTGLLLGAVGTGAAATFVLAVAGQQRYLSACVVRRQPVHQRVR